MAIPGTQSAALSTDLYYPGDANGLSGEAGRCPVIVLGHGFSQSKANHANQGLQLATRGYIVLLPNSNSGSDHSRFADDLIKCLLEYGLNTDPQAPDGPALPGSQLVELESGTYFAIRFPRVTAASDIIYQVESSADLRAWQMGSSYSGSGETPVTDATTEVSREGSGLETLIIRDNQPVEAGAGFLRLRVSRP